METKRLKRRCNAPQCGRHLSADNYSGVCRQHAHSAWCGCFSCTGIPAPARNKPKAPPATLKSGEKACMDCGAGIPTKSNSIRCRACAPKIVGEANRAHNERVAALSPDRKRGEWHRAAVHLANAIGWPEPVNDREARLLIAVAAGERDEVLDLPPGVALRTAIRRRLDLVR